MSPSSLNLSSRVFALLSQSSRRSRTIWFSLSLLIATVYGLLAIQQALGGDYVVQDDARQHIFWMQRYLDPELFPGDLIADYFQAIAPLGYASLYQFVAALGITPDWFSRILPLALGLMSAGYCFALCLEIIPVPVTGFLASVILSQNLWCSDELSSATPRAFLYPLFLAFLYYLVRQSRLVCLLLIALQVGFYPQISLVSLGLLGLTLGRWNRGRISLSHDWRDYGLLILGLGLTISLVLYTKSLSEFGSLVTQAEAETMAEFQPGGRNAFFLTGANYWLGGRSGLFHRRTLIPITLPVGLFLPMLLALPIKSGIRTRIKPAIYLLLKVLIVSCGLFLLAHLVLFQLHLPSRYTNHTIRMILAIAAGLTWTLLWEDWLRLCQAWTAWFSHLSGGRWLRQGIALWGEFWCLGLSGAVALVIVLYYPLLLGDFPKAGYYSFEEAQPVFEFFAQQPKDSLIASLSSETANIPTFSARSVFVSEEHGLAYHKHYYDQFSQRVNALMEAQYTQTPAVLADFIQTYGIDFWLLDTNTFQAAYVADRAWLNQFQPIASTVIDHLNQGQTPVLQSTVNQCTVLPAEPWIILDANCVYTAVTTDQ